MSSGAYMTFNPEHDTPRSELFYNLADRLEGQIDDPANLDDPKWLRRHASKVRSRALRKEKAVEHKQSQKSE